MVNVFTGREEDLLESENIQAEVEVYDHEELDNNQTSFKVIKVTSGSTDIQGQAFPIDNSAFEEGHEKYFADLKVSKYEGIPFPEIECLNISPLQ